MRLLLVVALSSFLGAETAWGQPAPAIVPMTRRIDFISAVDGHTHRVQIAIPFAAADALFKFAPPPVAAPVK